MEDEVTVQDESVRGSYSDICNAECDMLNKLADFRRAKYAYEDAVQAFKSYFEKKTIYYTPAGRKYFDTNPRLDARMLVEFEVIPKGFWGRGIKADKQAFTRGQWQRLIRKLKDEMKQKNREYSWAYLRFSIVSDGPKTFEKRKQAITLLEEELKKLQDKMTLIQNRIATLKK